MFLIHWPAVLLLAGGGLASLWLKKLTPAGALAGVLLGALVYAAVGYGGIWLMALFFVLATVATAWRRTDKIRQGLAAPSESRRTAAQVLANSGMAALLSAGALLCQCQTYLFPFLVASVFSAATADTLSSELGNVYGRRFYNILNLKKDRKGLDGVVSVEGTAAGVAGSLLIAGGYALAWPFFAIDLLIIVVAGTVGNLTDSVLGATLERKSLLNNNTVNFLNTAIAAAVAWFFYVVWR